MGPGCHRLQDLVWPGRSGVTVFLCVCACARNAACARTKGDAATATRGAGEATAGLAKRGTQRARARAHSEAEAAARPRHARCCGKPDNDGVGLQAKNEAAAGRHGQGRGLARWWQNQACASAWPRRRPWRGRTWRGWTEWPRRWQGKAELGQSSCVRGQGEGKARRRSNWFVAKSTHAHRPSARPRRRRGGRASSGVAMVCSRQDGSERWQSRARRGCARCGSACVGLGRHGGSSSASTSRGSG